MTDRESLEKFNKIYDETYSRVLKFVVCKCSDMEDVNDILQEIKSRLYRIPMLWELQKTKLKSITAYYTGSEPYRSSAQRRMIWIYLKKCLTAQIRKALC